MKFFRKSLSLFAVPVLLICMTTLPCFAVEPDAKADPQSTQKELPWNHMDKLHRGIVNSATGIHEIPNTMEEVRKDTELFEALTRGAALGIGKAIARTGVGIYDAATFLLPVPEDFEPLMQPEYVDPATEAFWNSPD